MDQSGPRRKPAMLSTTHSTSSSSSAAIPPPRSAAEPSARVRGADGDLGAAKSLDGAGLEDSGPAVPRQLRERRKPVNVNRSPWQQAQPPGSEACFPGACAFYGAGRGVEGRFRLARKEQRQIPFRPLAGVAGAERRSVAIGWRTLDFPSSKCVEAES